MKSGALCRISKRGGRRWKSPFWFLGLFHGLPRRVISTACSETSAPPRMSIRTERSDAGRCVPAASVVAFLPLFLFLGQNRSFLLNFTPGCSRNDDLTAPRPAVPPHWAPASLGRASCGSIHPASPGGGRCAPAGPVCCRPRSDPRSAGATGPGAVGW